MTAWVGYGESADDSCVLELVYEYNTDEVRGRAFRHHCVWK
jgi:hypothetical protein